MILVIKHVESEGPGTIESFFSKEGFNLRTIELYKNDVFPDDLSHIEAVIVMGGPMNVYEEDKYPFLKAEDLFIKKVLKEEIPFLGICLGSQLLAKAGGAAVTKAPKQEIGWFKAALTSNGKTDPLFKNMSQEFDVFQWHNDTFEIPKGGKHLATSKDCPNQAFKAGVNAYGLQFHIEVTDCIIKDWTHEHYMVPHGKLRSEAQDMLEYYPKVKNQFNKQADIIYRNFLAIMSKNKVAA